VDWGFVLQDVGAHVLLLHCADDRMVGLGHPRDLALRLPDANLEVLPGIGHVSVQAYAGRALAGLAANE
jgi:pimeloyl-ACP methyl ester carboxylesterase